LAWKEEEQEHHDKVGNGLRRRYEYPDN